MTDSKDNKVIQVGEIDPSKKTSKIVDPVESSDMPVEGDNAKVATCWFNGLRYSQGVRVCSPPNQFVCSSHGTWNVVGRC